MPKATIDGAQLEYHEAGRGESLVFVHGTLEDYRTWNLNQEAFAPYFRTIAYSRRYHWPNAPIRDGENYSMTAQVDDLIAFLHAVEATPAHLVGHSYGAFLCLLAAIKEPQSVRSLVLAEAPVLTLFISDPPKPGEILKLLVTRPRTAAALIDFDRRALSPSRKAVAEGNYEAGFEYFAKALVGPEVYAHLPEDIMEGARDNFSEFRVESSSKDAFAPLDAEDVRGIQAAALLVTGADTAAFLQRLTDYLQELLPNNQRVDIPDAGHMMHAQDPDTFNSTVLQFLGIGALNHRLTSAIAPAVSSVTL